MKLKYANDNRIPRVVKIWLIAGLVMIFLQVVIGGITRLTGSGLSITRWEVVRGAVPPLSEVGWEAEFELYKQTPQYARINQGMTLGEFKFIYFWEYFHRLWARLMGLVFIFPFLWFVWRGMLSRSLVLHLLVVVALAGLEGFFGWIMVKSGLIYRPWVNAYNLTLHLCMALIIFGYLLWTIFIAFQPQPLVFVQPAMKRFSRAIIAVAFVQIALGALMSGSKAGLFYPTWPDMRGEYLPSVLLDGSHWTADSFVHYDTNPFMPALIQFLHRNTAYVLTLMILYFSWKMRKSSRMPAALRTGVWVLLAATAAQVLLGIFTLINCKAAVPVGLGVLHQAGAVILFGVLLFVNYRLSATLPSSK